MAYFSALEEGILTASREYESLLTELATAPSGQREALERDLFKAGAKIRVEVDKLVSSAGVPSSLVKPLDALMKEFKTLHSEAVSSREASLSLHRNAPSSPLLPANAISTPRNKRGRSRGVRFASQGADASNQLQSVMLSMAF